MNFDKLPRGVPGTHVRTGAAPRALWMSPQTLGQSAFWSYDPNKIVLGISDGKRVGVSDNRHLMTIAGSRAGKGTSAIVPNLLVYPGSVLVLDPKGENATLTAERRGLGRDIAKGGLGHEVYVIDPFGAADVPEEYRAGFNPISLLDPESDTFIDDCDSIADALVVPSPKDQNDFWNSSARIILRGFIAWIGAAGGIENRDINTLREMLYYVSRPDLMKKKRKGKLFTDQEIAALETCLEYLLETMMVYHDVADGVPAEAAGLLASLGDRERASIMATVRQHIGFLSSPPMAKTLSSNHRCPDLKAWKLGGKSIYLCLPAGRLHRHSRFFRLFVNQLLTAVEQDKTVPDIPALMLLDEMHTLGHMSALETAAGLVAGFGVRLWSIWQDLNQLKHLYKDRWETFMGNAGIVQFFGVNDMTTLKYISDRLGKSSILSINQGEISTQQSVQGFSGESKTIQGSPLLSPDEVAYFFSRQSENQLVIFPGADPIFMKRLPFYHDIYREYLPNE